MKQGVFSVISSLQCETLTRCLTSEMLCNYCVKALDWSGPALWCNESSVFHNTCKITGRYQLFSFIQLLIFSWFCEEPKELPQQRTDSAVFIHVHNLSFVVMVTLSWLRRPLQRWKICSSPSLLNCPDVTRVSHEDEEHETDWRRLNKRKAESDEMFVSWTLSQRTFNQI